MVAQDAETPRDLVDQKLGVVCSRSVTKVSFARYHPRHLRSQEFALQAVSDAGAAYQDTLRAVILHKETSFSFRVNVWLLHHVLPDSN